MGYLSSDDDQPVRKKHTLRQRIQGLRGKEGLNALKWLKDRTGDHTIHTTDGSIGLGSITNDMSDEQLLDAIGMVELTMASYTYADSGSTSR